MVVKALRVQVAKRVSVGILVFLIGWLFAGAMVAALASAVLTGFAFYKDQDSELKTRELAKNDDEHPTATTTNDRRSVKKAPKTTRFAANKKGNSSGKAKQQKIPLPSDPRLAFVLKGHVHPITAISISDDAKLITTASADAVRIFDAAGLLTKPAKYTYNRIPLTGARVSALAISNCGAYVIYTLSKLVCIWQVLPFSQNKKPQEMATFQTDHQTQIDFVRFVTSGARPYIVTASRATTDTALRVWSKKGKLLATVPRPGRGAFAFPDISADGRHIVVPSKELTGFEILRDNADHVFQQIVPVMTFKGHTSRVIGVRYGSFPNGFQTVVSCSDRGEVYIWDTDVRHDIKQNPKLVAKLPPCEDVRHVALDNDLRCLAALTPKMLRLYKLGVGGTDGEVLVDIPMPNALDNGTRPEPRSVFFVPNKPFVGTLFDGCKFCLVWHVPQK